MKSDGLHVLMTTDAVGGVWTYATTLSRSLCRFGIRVTLVVQGPRPQEDQLAPLRDIRGLSVQPTDLALEWMDPGGADAARTRTALQAIAGQVKPDLVHLNSFREAAGEWDLPLLVVAHSCVRSWWRACHGAEPNAQWKAYVRAVGQGLAAADAWVAPSAAFRAEMASIYAPPASGEVIWNGIAGTAAKRAKEPFILAAGRMWDEAKNLGVLTAIAPQVPWPIQVAGPGADSCPQVASAGVRPLGTLPRPALLSTMERAGIFVAPALYEPFGLTVLEAASAGCALVLSDIPTFRELWDEAALFVDPREPKSVAAATGRLCADAALRRKLQAAAMRRAKRYDVSTMTTQYAALYSKLLRGALRPNAAASLRVTEARA